MSRCCAAASAGASAGVFCPTCPQCGQVGKAVSLLTLKHQVQAPNLAAVESGEFAFCRSPECPVVYFNNSGTVLNLADVRQRPTTKGGDNPQLCYCFGFDTAMVQAEIRATGGCTIPQRIAAEMKADRCACEIRNPQGSCCMTNVRFAVKRELAATRAKSSAG